MESAGWRSFYSLGSLEILDLPKVKSLSDPCTYNGKLQALILRNSEQVCGLANGGFAASSITKGTGYIYVPRALMDSYKTAYLWSNYANQFRAIEDYPEICGGE